jgi:hypothetical protein
MASKSNNYELGKLFLCMVRYITKPRINNLSLTFRIKFCKNIDDLKTFEDNNEYPYFLYQNLMNILVLNNEINISNIFLINAIINSVTTNYFGEIGVHKYNRRLYDNLELLDSNNIVLYKLINSNIEVWKQTLIIETLSNIII